MQSKVGIIGGGRMGSWFAEYFASLGSVVLVYDTKKPRSRFQSSNVLAADSIAQCISEADLVLVCVPVRLTPEVIGKCSGKMKSGAVLAEISSVKSKTFSALTKIRKDLRTLCLHPMFGPGASVNGQLKVLLIPVRNEQEELETARKFFQGASILVISSAKDHDNAIGIVLGLTYFNNLALADYISSQKDELLSKVAGTTFRFQSILAESVMTDEADLISVLIKDNPYARMHAKRFLSRAYSVVDLASKDNPAALEARIRKVKSRLERKGDLQRSYKRLYSLVQSMDD